MAYNRAAIRRRASSNVFDTGERPEHEVYVPNFGPPRWKCDICGHVNELKPGTMLSEEGLSSSTCEKCKSSSAASGDMVDVKGQPFPEADYWDPEEVMDETVQRLPEYKGWVGSSFKTHDDASGVTYSKGRWGLVLIPEWQEAPMGEIYVSIERDGKHYDVVPSSEGPFPAFSYPLTAEKMTDLIPKLIDNFDSLTPKMMGIEWPK